MGPYKLPTRRRRNSRSSRIGLMITVIETSITVCVCVYIYIYVTYMRVCLLVCVRLCGMDHRKIKRKKMLMMIRHVTHGPSNPCAVRPPSTPTTCPVMYEDAGRHKNTTGLAISSGCANRCIGVQS